MSCSINSDINSSTSTNQKTPIPCKVLIIEDTAVIRLTLKLALEMEGHEVVEAVDGQDALNILAKYPLPDLILLDLLMSGMNGWDFLAKIKNNSDHPMAHIPIIVVSAVADKHREISKIVESTVSKPILLDKLLSEVHRLCPAKS